MTTIDRRLPLGLLMSPLNWAGRALDWALACADRADQRRQLAQLDERMLRDIGLSHGDVLRETAKPFWQE